MKEEETNCPACGVAHFPGHGLRASCYRLLPADVGEDHPAFKLYAHCVAIAANVYSMTWGNYEPLTWPRPLPVPRGKPKEIIPEDLRWRVFERDGFACKHCGGKQMLRADHIHPESLGGEATFENLQTLCNRCNSRKGKKVAA